jgi:excinuclease UvrABC helicase subunit UvrB
LEEFGISSPETKTKKGKGRERETATLELDLMGDARPIEKILADKERQMKEAAHDLEFELAAILRDEIHALRERQKKPKSKR